MGSSGESLARERRCRPGSPAIDPAVAAQPVDNRTKRVEVEDAQSWVDGESGRRHGGRFGLRGCWLEPEQWPGNGWCVRRSVRQHRRRRRGKRQSHHARFRLPLGPNHVRRSLRRPGGQQRPLRRMPQRLSSGVLVRGRQLQLPGGALLLRCWMRRPTVGSEQLRRLCEQLSERAAVCWRSVPVSRRVDGVRRGVCRRPIGPDPLRGVRYGVRQRPGLLRGILHRVMRCGAYPVWAELRRPEHPSCSLRGLRQRLRAGARVRARRLQLSLRAVSVCRRVPRHLHERAKLRDLRQRLHRWASVRSRGLRVSCRSGSLRRKLPRHPGRSRQLRRVRQSMPRGSHV